MTQTKPHILKCVAILWSFLSIVSISHAQNARITWLAFSSGFGRSTAGNSAVTLNIGQSCGGPLRAGASQIYAGFLGSQVPLNGPNVVSPHQEFPKDFTLFQNFPNPFNPTTTISYQLPVTGHVSLKVYDAIGREVATLVNGVKEAGKYSVPFNVPKLASGIYIVRLQSGDQIQLKKMMLMK